MKNLSIVLSTYNEVENIKVALDSSVNHTAVKEIIVIDDNSSDGTIDILENYKHPKMKFVVRKNIRGLASAFIDGIKLSSGDYILRFDLDMCNSINHLMKTFENIKDEEDCMIFSRYIGTGFDERSNYRRLPSLILNKLCQLFLYSQIKDYTSCIIIFKRNILNEIFPKNTFYANFIIDFIFEMKKRNKTIKEVPFIQERSTELNSKSAPNVLKFFINGLFYLISLLRCSFNKFKK